MSRNVNSRFAVNPTNIDISRSTFDRPFELKTSFNAGELIPFYVDEVLPGDTHQIRTSKVIRMPSLITPVMDNIYLDTYYFFVPTRLTWEHWKEFNGENTKSAWIPTTEYVVPQLKAPNNSGWLEGTVADYMGIPIGVSNLSVNALPFRAYALICNEWFRDQNLMDPLQIPVDDVVRTGSNGSSPVTAPALGGQPFKVSKYHDYFTSCLPAPQKGPDVTINVGDQVPVYGNGPMFVDAYTIDTQPGKVAERNRRLGLESIGTGSSGKYGDVAMPLDASSTVQAGYAVGLTAPGNTFSSGVYADLSLATGVTINQLRQAFQLQKLYEKDARGGTRYIEILKAHFGVTSPDARLQRPEYLGGNRIPIVVNQVIQNSGTTDTSPQGNAAAYSLTSDSHGDFIHSFTEHGFIIGVMVARYDHTYQQGLERMWSRKTRFDYYWPVFANIGEQAVLNKEIYAQGTAEDDEVFGYQEAWADYRYKPSRVSGQMRSKADGSLDSWHLADDYVALPRLSASWLREDANNIDRVLAVDSSISNQFFGDIYVQNRTTRPMPLYSIPGLIDHH